VSYAVVGNVADSNRAFRPSKSASTATATDVRADLTLAPERIASNGWRDFP
jgi:hypothetical protein